MKAISSPDNPVIKLARKLHNKKYRERERLFLVEGRRSVKEALAWPELIKCVFLDENLAGEDLALPGIETFLLDARLFKSISTTENPQGMSAILKIPDWSVEKIASDKSLLVLLDKVSDPGNMGSIIRSCWALGVSGLLLTPECVDPYSPKVVRSSMGGVLNLPLFEAVNETMLEQLQSLGYEFLCTGLEEARDYYSADLTGAKVLVFGSEARGVSAAIKSRCGQTIKIPMKSNVDSLNVAAACAIIIGEAWGQRNGRSIVQ